MENKACKTRHNNTDELKAYVNSAWQSIKKGCKSFRPRLEHVITSKGGHMNNMRYLGVKI